MWLVLASKSLSLPWQPISSSSLMLITGLLHQKHSHTNRQSQWAQGRSAGFAREPKCFLFFFLTLHKAGSFAFSQEKASRHTKVSAAGSLCWRKEERREGGGWVVITGVLSVQRCDASRQGSGGGRRKCSRP